MGKKANLINSINDRFTSVDKSFFVSEEVLHRMINSLYAPGPSFFAIFNFENNRVEYISSEVREVLGLEPENRSMEEVMERIHQKDIAHIAKCQEIVEIFTNKILTPEEWPYYKRTFQYRMIHADGSTRLMLHQSMMIHDRDQNYLGKSFILASDISKFSEIRSDTISFIDTRGHHSYLNIGSLEELYKLTGSRNELSTREIEILKLISEGYKSRDIAKKLQITYDTVRTHRNNILKRHNFNNLTQALAYYIRKGFI